LPKVGTSELFVVTVTGNVSVKTAAPLFGEAAPEGRGQSARDAWGEAKVTSKELPCIHAALDIRIAHIVWGNFWLSKSVAGLTADE